MISLIHSCFSGFFSSSFSSLMHIRVSPSGALVIMVCLLRYAQVIEHSHHCWLNTSALVSGCTNAVGLVMVGNFQVNAHRERGEGWGYTQ